MTEAGSKPSWSVERRPGHPTTRSTRTIRSPEPSSAGFTASTTTAGLSTRPTTERPTVPGPGRRAVVADTTRMGDVEPVALGHHAGAAEVAGVGQQRVGERVVALVGVGVGVLGALEQGEAQVVEWSSGCRRRTRRAVRVASWPYLASLSRATPIAGLADVDPPVGAHLEAGGVPAGVGVDGGGDVAELDLAGEVVGVDVERERRPSARGRARASRSRCGRRGGGCPARSSTTWATVDDRNDRVMRTRADQRPASSTSNASSSTRSVTWRR